MAQIKEFVRQYGPSAKRQLDQIHKAERKRAKAS
jgi:hypothetical protein